MERIETVLSIHRPKLGRIRGPKGKTQLHVRFHLAVTLFVF